MIKKVLLILLAVITITVMIPTEGVAYAKTTDSEYAAKVLETLEIIKNDGQKDLTKNVTRVEFAKMLIDLSVYKDTVNEYTSKSLFKDVKKNYKGGGYIEFAISNNWMSGYIDGNFKPKKSITLQEAVNGVLHLLGYTENDFTGNKTTAKMAMYTSKNLDDYITKNKNQSLTKNDCINLLYNTLKATMKDTTVYGKKLGYIVNVDGDIEYLSIVNGEMDGPIIADTDWDKTIPIDTETSTYYRNDSLSNQKSIQYRDVLYYSKKMNTVWAYSERATGELKEILPNRLNPTEIKLGGNTFKLGNQEMSYQFSTMGDIEVGNIISVLIGKEDTVVGVLSGEDHDASIKGVLLDSKVSVSTDKDGNLYKTTCATILDSYGRKNVVESNNDIDSFVDNDVVEAVYMDGKATIKSISTERFAHPISGEVNKDATRLGTYAIAKDIRIIDLKGQQYMDVTPSRLAGTIMYQSDILYNSFNSNGEIQELILNNMTKDLYSYGVLTDTNMVADMYGQMVTYTYILDGDEKTATSKVLTDMLPAGPCRFEFINNNLESIVRLNGVMVNSIDGLEVKTMGSSYTMADEVAVYYMNDSKYFETTLSSVDDLNKLNLTAFYDRSMGVGGRVRVIIAQDK